MTEDEARAQAKRRNETETDPAYFHIATCNARDVWQVRQWRRDSVQTLKLPQVRVKQ